MITYSKKSNYCVTVSDLDMVVPELEKLEDVEVKKVRNYTKTISIYVSEDFDTSIISKIPGVLSVELEIYVHINRCY